MITFERLQLLIFFSTAPTFKSALIEKKENVQISYQFCLPGAGAGAA